MICSRACAVSRFCGCGMPWAMMVDSSATTGRFSANASRTSGAMSNAIQISFMRRFSADALLVRLFNAMLRLTVSLEPTARPARALPEHAGRGGPKPADEPRHIPRHMRITAAGDVPRLRLCRRNVILPHPVALQGRYQRALRSEADQNILHAAVMQHPRGLLGRVQA